MDILLNGEKAKAFVDNVEVYLSLDPSDEEQFKESLRRLLAATMVMEDVLRQAGVITEPPTDLALTARTRNPYYVSILANDGAKP